MPFVKVIVPLDLYPAGYFSFFFIDPCSSLTCGYGGTCVGNTGGSTCTCPYSSPTSMTNALCQGNRATRSISCWIFFILFYRSLFIAYMWLWWYMCGKQWRFH